MVAKRNEKCEARLCGRNLFEIEKKNFKPNEAITFHLKRKKFPPVFLKPFRKEKKDFPVSFSNQK
jgi:hypothetical protein